MNEGDGAKAEGCCGVWFGFGDADSGDVFGAVILDACDEREVYDMV